MLGELLELPTQPETPAPLAERLLPIPGAVAVKQDLIVSVAELRTVAGWTAFLVGTANLPRNGYPLLPLPCPSGVREALTYNFSQCLPSAQV